MENFSVKLPFNLEEISRGLLGFPHPRPTVGGSDSVGKK